MYLSNVGLAQDSVVYAVTSNANACAGPPVNYTIYVNPDAKATYTFTKDTACWPFVLNSVIQNNSPITADSSYEWYVDDVLIGTGYNFPGYTIQPSDTFVDIKMVAYSLYGCKNDSTTHRFYTKNEPHPDFAVTYSNPPCGPLVVQFQNLTMTHTPNPFAPFNYSWNFGNGNTSNLQNPAPQTYQANPLFTDTTYYATLTVYNDCISKDTTLAITVKAPPKAQFAPDVTNICSNDTIFFTNTSLGIDNSYEWNYGDGSALDSTNTNNPVQHIYNVGSIANYLVVLVATNQCGTDTARVPVTIYPSNVHLNWYITANTQSGCAPHIVEVTNVSAGGAFFDWNFGDNSPIVRTGNNAVITHTYTTPGIYNITVNGHGCSDTSGVKQVRVIRSPLTSFSVINNNACPGSNVQFSNLTDTANSFIWNFGDPTSGIRNTSNSTNPTHQYNTPGVYTVTLIASLLDSSGTICTATSTFPVNVVAPDVDIVAPIKGCVLETVLFTPVIRSVSGLPPISYTSWQVNGVPYPVNPQYAPQFSYVFSQPGTYTVSLIVGTALGCYDTATISITINSLPQVNVSGDKQICLGSNVQLNAISSVNNYSWSPNINLSCLTCSNPIASPISTLRYFVTTTDSTTMCSAKDSVLVTVIQPFTMLVDPNDTICIGQSTQLNVDGATYYTWTPPTALSCTTCSNPIANPTTTITYQVTGRDIYGCFSDTKSVTVAVGQYPQVTLPPSQTLATGTQYPIFSLITNGPIASYLWTPATDLSCDDCRQPIATIKNNICYTLSATNIYGCEGSDTICFVAFCKDAQVKIPNAFMPGSNGVGNNRDKWFTVYGRGIGMVKRLTVFNRWGTIVFEKNNFPSNVPELGWDGRVRDVYASPDVYVYIAEVTCDNGSSFFYKGNVTILK